MAKERDPDFVAEEMALLRASSHPPSPEELQAYEEISPGLAHRLIRIYELQQRMVREEMEEHEHTRRAAYIVRIISRILLLIAILGIFGTAAFLVQRGFSGSAYILGATGVVPLIWLLLKPTFESAEITILGLKVGRKDREDRDPE